MTDPKTAPADLMRLFSPLLRICCELKEACERSATSGEKGAEDAERKLKNLVADRFRELEAVEFPEAKNPAIEDALRLIPKSTTEDSVLRDRQPARYLGRYACAALIDELVLRSGLAIREAWTRTPLQSLHFNEANAGEQFYTIVDTLRKAEAPESRDVLCIYYLCLELGFRGKHGFEDAERRDLIRKLNAELCASLKDRLAALSPAGAGR